MKRLLLGTCLVTSGLLVGGCGSTTKYVEPNSSRLVTEVGKINIQDFSKAAMEMLESLNSSLISQNKLQSAVAGQPSLLAISRIQNNTSSQIDTDLLVKKIRVELLRTGKVQTSTTIGLGGPEDPLAAEALKRQQVFDDRNQPRIPDYTLSGKIIEDRSRSGKTQQSAYIFQLSLSSTAGVAVWEDEKVIVKQGSRPSVGF